MLLERRLDELASRTLTDVLGLTERAPALLRPTQDPRFGDYQLNGVLPLAKKLGKNPRELATAVAEALAKNEAFSGAEVAGPGFVNLRVRDEWLANELVTALRDPERDGIPVVDAPTKIVVDFSSPNVAKQMHVGHLRSTIIGASIVSMFRFVGHEVIGDNHIGDWGTQFGLLIVGMREWGDSAALERDAIVELERVYKLASNRAKEDEAFAESARRELAKLQSGDAENRALWQRFVDVTRKALDSVYAELGVTFDTWLGESAYDGMLAPVVDALLRDGLAREDDGAICVFFSELASAPAKLKKQKEPFIVRKRDGAFLYATTDIATVLYRRDTFAANRCVYVVDVRQGQHFEQLFAVAQALGVEMKLEHVGFGTVLGEDGRPLRTRDGGTVTLKSLLDEAKTRAEARIREGIAEGRLKLDESEVAEVARAVGIGAVKFADLSQNRLTDYKFEWDKMISFQGRSGPYLQYTVARCGAIFRKGDIDAAQNDRTATLVVTDESESALIRQLARFGDVVHQAAESCNPHFVAEQLFELAGGFNTFYSRVKVLEAPDEATRASRLALVSLTRRQLARGLGLLGIETVERM